MHLVTTRANSKTNNEQAHYVSLSSTHTVTTHTTFAYHCTNAGEETDCVFRSLNLKGRPIRLAVAL